MTRLPGEFWIPSMLAGLGALAACGCGGSRPAERAASEVATPGNPDRPARAGGPAEPDVAPPRQPGAGGAAGATDAGAGTFTLRDAPDARAAHGARPSRLKPSASHAVLKLVVQDKESGPRPGIVVKLTAPDGTQYFTEETDAEGYTEILVPNGRSYELTYLTLGRKDIGARVEVSGEPNQNIKLTLRYRREVIPPLPPLPRDAPPPPAARFILEGVEFDTGKATIRPESYPRLDAVVEYLQHKKSARIEISGHTDNVGNPRANQQLSEKRAQACRDYLIGKGIDGARIQAVGHGDSRPIAPNDSEAGRQKNRRIEAAEL